MDLFGLTNTGKVRRQNQDVFKILFDETRDIAVLVVCDGMGGARAGNVASSVAAETFMHHMGKYVEESIGSQSDMAKKMAGAVVAANKAVYDKSNEHEEFRGMGTTLTAAISTPSGEVVVNVGDSRLYYVTSHGITQVTRDHSVVEDMITRGDLTRTEARRHPNRNLITRALGTNRSEEPDVFLLKLEEKDYLLLCSDGLSNLVLDSEILFELQHASSVKDCCEKLVEMALERGAPDNVTAVIYRK
ncbi:MAG: Stp1/IreP family PP2C-type Ser/Thr phosphatase [Oscillospiraceae bacterium]|nr:Stp1/IreP family PP2C-type Ser/Thr phosphatase [Oscillospiraceae bacterium]